MIQDEAKKQIFQIWDSYVLENKPVADTKGNVLENIDEKRKEAVHDLNGIIDKFQNGMIDLAEFKTDIDSYNKQNNLWGFTSIKGQMFFNLLVKTCESELQLQQLTALLKRCISKPTHLSDSLAKIDELDKYTQVFFNKAPDKRRAPNPGSVGYFLSYFWQIYDFLNWPIMYSSMINSFIELGIWANGTSKSGAYNAFYLINEEIKSILSAHAGRTISNWDAEHAFWTQRTSFKNPKPIVKEEEKNESIPQEEPISNLVEASFNIYDYLPPITSKLIDLGNDSESVSSTKGRKFEIAVCEAFKQLGFNVQLLGQGSGREPDLIAINKEDNEAFIVDAKAYPNGYVMSAGEERAIKEYIQHHCPRLQKEGIKKIGFIIVSNFFKSEFETFISETTWKTDVKRFILLSSEALLHLLAYKIKDQLHLSQIVEALISLGNKIAAPDVIQKFDDI